MLANCLVLLSILIAMAHHEIITIAHMLSDTRTTITTCDAATTQKYDDLYRNVSKQLLYTRDKCS